ncbi:hypothetical protein GGI42DRAFT_328507 [Trichoderma sp. SZMC 28013]
MQQHCFIQTSKTNALPNKFHSIGRKMKRSMLATATRTHLLPLVYIDILQHLPIMKLSPYPYLASRGGRERAMDSTVSGNSLTPFFRSR